MEYLRCCHHRRGQSKNADVYIGLAEAYIGLDDNDSAVDTLERGYDLTSGERIKKMIDGYVVSSLISDFRTVQSSLLSSPFSEYQKNAHFDDIDNKPSKVSIKL